MPKEDWVSVDVITMAAPDLRDKSNMHAVLLGNGTYMNNAELFKKIEFAVYCPAIDMTNYSVFKRIFDES